MGSLKEKINGTMKEECLHLIALLLSSFQSLFVLYLLHVMEEVMHVDEPVQILKYLVWEPCTYSCSGSLSPIQSILHNSFLKNCLQSVLCSTGGSLA